MPFVRVQAQPPRHRYQAERRSPAGTRRAAGRPVRCAEADRPSRTAGPSRPRGCRASTPSSSTPAARSTGRRPHRERDHQRHAPHPVVGPGEGSRGGGGQAAQGEREQLRRRGGARGTASASATAATAAPPSRYGTVAAGPSPPTAAGDEPVQRVVGGRGDRRRSGRRRRRCRATSRRPTRSGRASDPERQRAREAAVAMPAARRRPVRARYGTITSGVSLSAAAMPDADATPAALAPSQDVAERRGRAARC